MSAYDQTFAGIQMALTEEECRFVFFAFWTSLLVFRSSCTHLVNAV